MRHNVLFSPGLGLNGDDEATAIGPIPVVAGDTMVQVEAKIREWLKDNYDDFTPPEEGFLKFAHAGKVLDTATTLFDAHVGTDSTLEMMEADDE